jgi:L-serine deaminase
VVRVVWYRGTLSLHKSRDFSDIRIIRALATAGLFGNIVKHNASISGAEVGCQGEVGVACAMASAAANQLFAAVRHKRNMLLNGTGTSFGNDV